MTQRNALWRQPDFLRVWVGQTVSVLGSQVSVLALPLTAAVALNASAFEMGVLEAAQYVPFLVLGLLAGVWVDRLRRRPIMIVADVGRAVLLTLLPLAALLNVLAMWQLYVVACLVGVLTLFFDVAYSSYLPSLVGRDQLVDGNSKFELTRSAAQLVSPGIGGIIIQVLTAPVAILVDAASFVVSGVSLLLVTSREPAVAPATEHSSLWSEMRYGLSMLMHDGVLRPILFTSITVTLFSNVSVAVYVLYVTRELAISPAGLGIISIFSGVGALPGAVLGRWISERFGIGPTLMLALIGVGCGELLVPLASGSRGVVVGLLIASQTIVGLAFVIWNINQLSLRQGLTPDHLLGRVNAAYRFLVWGAIPLGALIGGALGTATGLREALFVSAFGVLIGPLWILASPVRSLKTASAQQAQSQPEPQAHRTAPALTRLRAGVRILTMLADDEYTGQILLADREHAGGVSLSAGNLQHAWFDSRDGVPALDMLVQTMLDPCSLSFREYTPMPGEPLLDRTAFRDHVSQRTCEIEALLAAVPRRTIGSARSNPSAEDVKVSLDHVTVRTVLAIDGRRTVAELVNGAGSSETIRLISRFIEAGLLQV